MYKSSFKRYFLSLFDKLKFIKPEITKSVYEQKGSCNDVKLRSGNTYCMAEIKVRMDCDLHTSVKYGPYCEFIKFAAIKRKAESIMRAKDIKIRLLYINFTKDGVAIYELKDIKKYVFEWKLLPESSVDKTLIDKYVAKLKNPIEIIKYSDYEIGSHGSFKISEK